MKNQKESKNDIRCMFCGEKLGKFIVIARKSDGKKVRKTNTGYIRHFPDGRVIAVCYLCKHASSNVKKDNKLLPSGWGEISDSEISENCNEKRVITLQELSDKLKELLENNYEVKRCLEKLSK